MSKDAPGMRGERARNASGPLRRKRGDTKVETIELEYDRNFDVRGDMRLDTLLKRTGHGSLNDLIDSDLGKKA